MTTVGTHCNPDSAYETSSQAATAESIRNTTAVQVTLKTLNVQNHQIPPKSEVLFLTTETKYSWK